jgi:hypothetical protein
VSDVAAIVIGPRPDCARALEGAAVRTRVPIPSLSELHDAARAVDASLLWLLDSGAAPSPQTLAPLLEDRDGPAVSLPVDGAGAPVAAMIGRFRADDVNVLLDTASRRRVPLRSSRVYSLVVAREAVLDGAQPDCARFGPYAGTAWTAALFATRRAMLVPASRIHVGGPEAGSPIQAARVARAGIWGPAETLRELRLAAGAR